MAKRRKSKDDYFMIPQQAVELAKRRCQPHIEDWARRAVHDVEGRNTFHELAVLCWSQGVQDMLCLCEQSPMKVVPFIGNPAERGEE
jgi:hypothetical protein